MAFGREKGRSPASSAPAGRKERMGALIIRNSADFGNIFISIGKLFPFCLVIFNFIP